MVYIILTTHGVIFNGVFLIILADIFIIDIIEVILILLIIGIIEVILSSSS